MNILLENIKMALSSIWGNKIRSILTLLGVVIGVFAIITIVAIGTGLKESIVKEIVSLGADVLDIMPGETGSGAAAGISQKFSENDVKNLKQKADLVELTGVYEFSATAEFAGKEQTVFVMGSDPLIFQIRERKIAAGTIYTQSESQNRENVAVIGYGLANKFFFNNPEYSINQQIRVNGIAFKIIGVMDDDNFGFGGISANNMVYMPGTTAAKYFPDVGIMEIFARSKNKDEVNKAKLQVELILRETMKDRKFSVLGQDSLLDLVNNITGVITTSLAGLAAISLFVGGIGIMNIMLVSVTERTKEIGIRKAIGATEGQILTQFLTESVVLSMLGGIIGLGIAAGLSAAVTFFFDLPTLINIETVFGAIFFSVTVGVIFGTAPALKAAKKDPIDALRYE